MKLNSFLKECNEKEVFKMLSIYIVSSWVLIQVLAVTWQPLALPEKSVTYLILVLLIGFPIYIFYIWKSRLAPLEKERDLLSKNGKPKRSKFQKMYFSFFGIISLLSVAAVVLIINNAFNTKTKLVSLESSDKIGILKFGNNTGSESLDVVSKMSADWITHGITENKIAQVVSPEIVSDYISIIKATELNTDDESVLKKYFKPAKVISGNFYLNGDNLIFQSSITDGDINKTLISFKPVECDKGSPLECIEALKQLILGYLITEDKQILNLQEFPPKYKAYQYFLDAKSNFSNDQLYIELLNKAIDEDSNYFEPKVLRIAHYYGLGDYKKADSLRKAILPNSRINKRQQNLLNHYQALIQGDNAKIYNTIKNEYNLAPFDLQSNSSTMVVALQYVNRPQDVDSIFKKIPMSGMDVESCTFCQFRYFTQSLAKLELGQYKEVITLLEPVLAEVNELYLKRPVIAAYIRDNNLDGLNAFLKRQELVSSQDDMVGAYIFAGKELVLQNKNEMAASYLDKITTIDNPTRLAEVAYLKEDYKTAETLFRKLLVNDPLNIELHSRLAVCYYKNGKINDAEKVIQTLNDLRAENQYGSIDYSLAQYYAAIPENENAIKHLLRATADGDTNSIMRYQNDFHFKALKDSQEFKDILTYWY